MCTVCAARTSNLPYCDWSRTLPAWEELKTPLRPDVQITCYNMYLIGSGEESISRTILLWSLRNWLAGSLCPQGHPFVWGVAMQNEQRTAHLDNQGGCQFTSLSALPSYTLENLQNLWTLFSCTGGLSLRFIMLTDFGQAQVKLLLLIPTWMHITSSVVI